MKNKWISLLLVLSILFFVACNPDEDEDDPTPTDITGTWKVKDAPNSEYGEQNYYVDISKDISVSAQYNIDNFFNLGLGKKFSCVQNGSSLTLSSTPFEGFTFSGTGTISSNFKSINWSYTFDEGNGPVSGTSTYTKM